MYTTTVTRYEEKKEAEKDVEPFPVPRERIPASQPIIWRNVIGIIVLHFLAVYGFVTGYRDAKFWTWIWSEYTSRLRELSLSPTLLNFLRLAAAFILTRSEFQSNRLLTYQIFELAGKSIFILFSLPTFVLSFQSGWLEPFAVPRHDFPPPGKHFLSLLFGESESF